MCQSVKSHPSEYIYSLLIRVFFKLKILWRKFSHKKGQERRGERKIECSKQKISKQTSAKEGNKCSR
jgi:hypothetical protein